MGMPIHSWLDVQVVGLVLDSDLDTIIGMPVMSPEFIPQKLSWIHQR